MSLYSDIDLLVLTSAATAEMEPLRKALMQELPDYVDKEFPCVDVKVMRTEVFLNPEEGTEYGEFVKNCRRDGIRLWPKM